MKKLWIALTVIFMLALAPVVIADDPPATPTATTDVAKPATAVADKPAAKIVDKLITAPTEVTAPDEKPSTSGEMGEQIEKIANDWKSLGWIYGVIGMIGLLMMALRFKPINDFFESKGIKWLKPYISAGLGLLSGFFTAWAETGKIWPTAVIAAGMGLIAGLAAVGGHQVFTKANSK